MSRKGPDGVQGPPGLPSCQSCRFFELHNSEFKIGECKRNPPQQDDYLTTRYWPKVALEDWCGTFEARDPCDPVPGLVVWTGNAIRPWHVLDQS